MKEKGAHFCLAKNDQIDIFCFKKLTTTFVIEILVKSLQNLNLLWIRIDFKLDHKHQPIWFFATVTSGQQTQNGPVSLPRQLSLPAARNSVVDHGNQHKTENRLTRISLAIVWLFLFCHVWKLIPTMYEVIQHQDEDTVITTSCNGSITD